MANVGTPDANVTGDTFARELTELSRKHGLWLTDEPELSAVEGPDAQKLRYVCDETGKLTLDGLNDGLSKEQDTE
jgi:hypothetical protein